jgi:hypothetical protein
VTGRAAIVLGPNASAKLRDAGKIVGWGLVLYAAVQLVGSKLSTRSVGALALQMVLAEWGAGRLGVSWSDPTADIPTLRAILVRVMRGAAFGFGAAAAVIAFAFAARGLVWRPNTPVVSELALSLATACLLAARDELLLRGIPLRAFRHACPLGALLLVCGGAGAAAEYGILSATGTLDAARVAAAGLLAVTLAALWLVDRGGWLAFGAHAAWTFTTGGAIRGGLLDLRSTGGRFGGGDGGLSESLAALLMLALLSALALAIIPRWSERAQKR